MERETRKGEREKRKVERYTRNVERGRIKAETEEG